MVTIRSGKNITHSDQIGDDVILAGDIAAGAVGASEIATDAVEADEIKAGAVGTSEVADNTLTTDDLGAGSVGTSEIVDESVSQADMEDGTAGDLPYYTTGGEYARLPKGLASQVLTMNAGATAPEWQTPATPVALTLFPQRNGAPVDLASVDAISGRVLNSNTTMYLSQILITHKITLNKITTKNNGVSVEGTLDLTIYSEDGQTQHVAVTTPNITNGLTVETAVSAVVLNPGIYYLGVNTNGTADLTMFFYFEMSVDGDTTGAKSLELLSGEPTVQGRLTITAGTPPATIDPTAFTAYDGKGLIFARFDN